MTGEGTTYTELAVALGRVEEKVTRIADMDDRLRAVEKTVERLDATQRPKTPWYFVVAGVGGIITGVGGLITLLILLPKIH